MAVARFAALLGYLVPEGERCLFMAVCYTTVSVLHLQLTISHLALEALHRPEVPPPLPAAPRVSRRPGGARIEPRAAAACRGTRVTLDRV